MIYKAVLTKRLERKRSQLSDLESIMNIGEIATPVEKRKYIELKAVIQELENCLDVADAMFENQNDKEEERI